MSLKNQYRIDLPGFEDPSTTPGQPPPIHSVGVAIDSGIAQNVEEIDLRQWSFFVSIKSTGAPKAGPTAEGSITGVCGAEGSANGPNMVSTATSADLVTDVCDRAVVVHPE